jgi:hypothetical protein
VKYRNIPHTVEAVQWTGDNYEEIREFAWTGVDTEAAKLLDTLEPTLMVYISVENQWVVVRQGWWVVRGIRGEFYPCEDDVFRRTYEPVE